MRTFLACIDGCHMDRHTEVMWHAPGCPNIANGDEQEPPMTEAAEKLRRVVDSAVFAYDKDENLPQTILAAIVSELGVTEEMVWAVKDAVGAKGVAHDGLRAAGRALATLLEAAEER